MGSDAHYPEEAPAHRVRVDAFSIDRDAGDQRRVRDVRRRRPATSRSPSGRSTRPTSRARRPRTWCRARWCSRRRRGPVDLRHLSQWWTWTPGACWRAPEGPGSVGRRSARPPGRARRARGRRGVRRLGGRGAADRGRVGVRRARRPRRRRVHLGRRAAARRPDHGEHLGRARLPVAQHRRERVHAHRAGRALPAERVRPLRHGRQRLGVDRRLVDAAATPTTPTSRAASRRTRAAATSRRATTRRSRSSGSRAR